MGKWRFPTVSVSEHHQEAAGSTSAQHRLPPLPPLQPRPDFLTVAAAQSSAFQEAADASEPLDYSMKRPRSPSSLSASGSPSGSSQLSRGSSVSPSGGGGGSGEEVLHRLRHAVLQRHREQPLSSTPPSLAAEALAMAAAAAVQQRRPSPPTAQVAADPELEAKAAFAAECIKSRLDGCGKRVHLFLGILLHFGMPPGLDGVKIFDREVIGFSDEHKNASRRPTAYFMVLESKVLALIWSKFKGNSSCEYSTLTRAIRSTRQKYRGIFESVENPGKKLYKFGPIALEQFRQLFPSSYAPKVEMA